MYFQLRTTSPTDARVVVIVGSVLQSTLRYSLFFSRGCGWRLAELTTRHAQALHDRGKGRAFYANQKPEEYSFFSTYIGIHTNSTYYVQVTGLPTVRRLRNNVLYVLVGVYIS